MSKLHILPESNGETNTVQESLTRAGIRYVEIVSLHELWPHIVEGVPIVARVPESALLVLIRHMSTLLGEPPIRIDSAPGSKYTYEWNTSTANLHSEVWETLEGKFAKSGLLASTSTEVEERSKITPQGHKTEESNVRIRERAIKSDNTNSVEAKPTSYIDLDELDEGENFDSLVS